MGGKEAPTLIKEFEFRGISEGTFLYDLVRSWHKILKEFEERMYPLDLGYGYQERTNIGFLAAAASRNGCSVLEEFQCDKRRRNKRRLGRGDLWIKTSKGREYQFEAKQVILKVKTKDIKPKVSKALESALDDAKQVEEKPKKLVGLVFVIPYLSSKLKEHQDCIDKLRNDLLDVNELGADFAVVHFCKKEIVKEKYDPGNCWPCVALVGKYHREYRR